jgi:D-glycero-alpha-D-manno-heptose 1-phosphate guanylyltransferase
MGRNNVNSTEKMPSAVVLAGGLGTRLRTAYDGGPKSMAPVAGRPFLDYLLTWLGAKGITNVVLCVGYRRSQIQRFVGRGRKWGLRVQYSVEFQPLGTAGALKNAEPFIDRTNIIVINGDTFLDVDLNEMIRLHRMRGAVVTLAAVRAADTSRYGTIHLHTNGRIKKFFEKRENTSTLSSRETNGLINGGVYVFENALLSMIPRTRPSSFENSILPLLVAGKRAYGYVTDSYFIDIGLPTDFRRAQRELPRRICIDYPHKGAPTN